MDSSHNYGEACRLAPVLEPRPDDALLDGIPPINAQFFYHSLIPIDDPLSTATIAPTSDSKSAKGILRPFSHADNNALERAWLELTSPSDRETHQALLKKTKFDPALAARNAQKLSELIQELVCKHKEKHAHDNQPRLPLEEPSESLASGALPVCCQELLTDASTMLRETFCEVSRRKQRVLDQESVVERAMAIMSERERPSPIAVPARVVPSAPTPSPRTDGFVMPGLSTSSRGRASSLASNPAASRSASTESRAKRLSMASTSLPDKSLPKSGLVPVRPPTVDDGISGKPFLKVGDPGSKPSANSVAPLAEQALSDAPQIEAKVLDSILQADPSLNDTHPKDQGSEESRPRSIEVAVGVSRLHMVALPALQMKPIYWSPVNDISIVSRATWFYRDTMFPVETLVANQLEAGYRELRPFTQTWNDEIRCAVDVGADGEEKVSHPLWPETADSASGNLEEQETSEPAISSDPFCAARCFQGEAAAEGTLRPASPQVKGPYKASSAGPRMHATYHVIYKDGNSAFLLKPSLKPSTYYGRRPVSKIMKGLTVGTPVVRGFDRSVWDALHEKKKSPSTAINASGGITFASYTDRQPPPGLCPGCEMEKTQGRVTDLVLVAHGIGQKFAERVESFHFTHAVTAFRRTINIELGSETVKPVLRKEFSGIMVLPLNWRHTLSLDDGGPMSKEDEAGATPDGFTLKDIEPGTIPAVRSLISDVMFDIPFYMSHHKPKMIQALVTEANRVYRLWCRNNPEFLRNGRVHLIAHSLGSVMALEVLSKQPDMPPPLDLTKTSPESLFFEFDTTNLFLLGSPAGFFLLLERGSLMPRRGRRKPGAEMSICREVAVKSRQDGFQWLHIQTTNPDYRPAIASNTDQVLQDTIARDVVGDRGCFGCLAVDNIYNILAKEDPIAYLLNGTIDPLYAASLKVAHVPSTATSWLKSMGEVMRGLIPVTSAPGPDGSVPALAKPPTFRLPSQLELEVHDFTREEISERKAFLLNDNGQVDFYLRSGTGPLEIQYLNMLSAHTSYWTRMDLVRLLCMEIGREPGRTTALPAMRAMKLTRRDRPGK